MKYFLLALLILFQLCLNGQIVEYYSISGQTREDYPSEGFQEYGHVNSKCIPDGYWLYAGCEGWRPAKGKVENGYKVGRWYYPCVIPKKCYTKYRWNWNRTKTIISKNRRVYD